MLPNLQIISYWPTESPEAAKPEEAPQSPRVKLQRKGAGTRPAPLVKLYGKSGLYLSLNTDT